MKQKDYYNPLWVINLKNNKTSISDVLFSLNEQMEALSYLDAMNTDFQKFTELYFKHIEKTPEIEKTLKDISDRFVALHELILFVKTLLNSLK